MSGKRCPFREVSLVQECIYNFDCNVDVLVCIYTIYTVFGIAHWLCVLSVLYTVVVEVEIKTKDSSTNDKVNIHSSCQVPYSYLLSHIFVSYRLVIMRSSISGE